MRKIDVNKIKTWFITSISSSVGNFIIKNNLCEYLIVNFWDTLNNYGACLTAYAMQELLMSLGFNVKHLETDERSSRLEYKGSFGNKFTSKYLHKTSILNFKQAKKLTENIKGVILGSDQVLRLQYMNKYYNKYLLNFVDKKCKKIALSASFGIDKQDFLTDRFSTKKNIKMMTSALKSFDYLSCREISGKEIYKNIFGLDSDMILDPVFLVDKSRFDDLCKDSEKDFSNKIVNYILDEEESQASTFEYLAKKLKTDVISLNRMSGETSISDWLKAIKDCKFFVTDSFHGACFALIFNKPFICLKNKNRGSARFDSLIEIFDIKDSFVSSIEEIKNKDLDITPDWEKINSVLEKEKSRCLDILRKILFENFSNNTKRLANFQRIKFRKKINYELKILKYKVNIAFNKRKKTEYAQKIKTLKHSIEWE